MMANERARCVKQLRTETRMKVLLSGEVRVRGASAACRVHDLSRGGACLESDRPGLVGDCIQFVRGQLTADGRIAWVRGRRFGIRFDIPIRATELLVQMSHNRQSQAAAEQQLISVAAVPSPSR